MKIIEKEQIGLGCPTTFDIKTDDNRDGTIYFRWGGISLELEDGTFISDQISDKLDGIIDWEEIVEWLNTKEIEDLTE